MYGSSLAIGQLDGMTIAQYSCYGVVRIRLLPASCHDDAAPLITAMGQQQVVDRPVQSSRAYVLNAQARDEARMGHGCQKVPDSVLVMPADVVVTVHVSPVLTCVVPDPSHPAFSVQVPGTMVWPDLSVNV